MCKRSKIAVGIAVVGIAGVAVAGAAYAWGGGHFAKRIYGKVKKALALNADQEKKVDALKERVVASVKAKRGVRDALIGEAKTIWRGDTIDDAKVDALVAKIDERRVAFRKVVVGALKELHGILDKAQREKLVQLIEKFRKKMRGKWMKHHG